jgi:hypothetical protein
MKYHRQTERERERHAFSVKKNSFRRIRKEVIVLYVKALL